MRWWDGAGQDWEGRGGEGWFRTEGTVRGGKAREREEAAGRAMRRGLMGRAVFKSVPLGSCPKLIRGRKCECFAEVFLSLSLLSLTACRHLSSM